jgi:hypothetical protein
VAWQPLSVREGWREPDGPYEGVPPHLEVHLYAWLDESLRDGAYTNEKLVKVIAAQCRVDLPLHMSAGSCKQSLLTAAVDDHQSFLEIIDCRLHLTAVHRADVGALRFWLSACGSVWTTSKDGSQLVRRVDESATAAFEQATTPADAVSVELALAWGFVYGRDPSASRGWDHSIKALEAVLTGLVCPKNAKATLGTVIADLNSQISKWQLTLRGPNDDGSIAPLVAMLRLVWPNPDRHQGNHHRSPSLEEAQAIVHVTVTIVQWARSGALARRPTAPTV